MEEQQIKQPSTTIEALFSTIYVKKKLNDCTLKYSPSIGIQEILSDGKLE